MNDGISLALQVPRQFFLTLLQPSAIGGLWPFAAAATASLICGVVIGVLRRKTILLSFLIPIALSQLLLVLASLPGAQAWAVGGWALVGFLGFQAVLCGYLIWRAAGARLPATLLTIFSLIYAAFATFAAVFALLD
jgi:hypothetical protein